MLEVVLLACVMLGWLCGAACVILWQKPHQGASASRGMAGHGKVSLGEIWICSGKYAESFHNRPDCGAVPKNAGKMRLYRRCLRCDFSHTD